MCKGPLHRVFSGPEQPSAEPIGATPTTPAFTCRQAFIAPDFLTINTLCGAKAIDTRSGMQRGSHTHSSPRDHDAVALEMDLELALLTSGIASDQQRKAEDCLATGDAAVLGDLSNAQRFKRLLSEVSSSRDGSHTSSDAQRMAELQLLEQQVQQQQRRLQEQQQMLLESQRRNQQLIRYIRAMSANHPNALRTATGFMDAAAGVLSRTATQPAAQQSRPKLFRAVRSSSTSTHHGAAAAATQQQLALMLESVSNEDLSQALQQALQQQLSQQQQHQQQQEAPAVRMQQRRTQQQQQQQQQLQTPHARSESPASSGSHQQQQKQRKPKSKKPTHVPISACFEPPAAPAAGAAGAQGIDGFVSKKQKTAHLASAATAAPYIAATASAPCLAAPAQHQPDKQQQQLQLQLQLPQQPSVQSSIAPSPDTMLSSTGGGSSSSCSAAVDLPPLPAEFSNGVLRFNSSCGDLLSLLEGLGGAE